MDGKFGGNTFGGSKFGGSVFGGNKFGASAGETDPLREMFAKIMAFANRNDPQTAPHLQPAASVAAAPPPLPAFDQPGQSLPMQNYMPPPAAPQQGPGPSAAPPQAPPMPQGLPPGQPQAQAAVPPMPPSTQVSDGSVRGDLQSSIQQLLQQQRLLPEQWKGAFSNQYGAPA